MDNNKHDSLVVNGKKSLKKKLRLLSLCGVGLGAAVLGSKVAIDNIFNGQNTKEIQKTIAPDYYSLITQTNDDSDYNTLLQYIKWAEEIPSGRTVLDALKKHKTQLFMLNLVGNSYGVSFPDLSGICLNSALLNEEENKYLGFAAFIHEAEHIRVMGLAHQNGIGLKSFQSLDDRYIFGTLNEALAVRKSVQAIQELIEKHPDWSYAHKWKELVKKEYGVKLKGSADEAFKKRMENLTGLGASSHYEEHIPQIKEEIKNLKNMPKNPNWNKIVQIISDNEVQKVSSFPVPSFQMIRDMIKSEIVEQECRCYNEGNKNYQVHLKDLDLSCILENKTKITPEKLNDFCYSICGDIAYVAEEIYSYHKDDSMLKKWFSELKTLMPERQIDMLKNPDKTNIQWKKDQDLNDFLVKQDNYEYLKQAQKILSSKQLSFISPNEPGFYYLQRIKNLLKIYDELFFAKENQKKLSQRRTGIYR